MTNPHRSSAIALALAALLCAAPGARAEKEKELLKTKARMALLTPDGKILAAASKDNVRVIYLDIKKSRLIAKEYSPITLSPDGKFLGTLMKLAVDDDLYPAPIYDMKTLEGGGAVTMPSVGALAFCVAPGGKTCAYGTLKDLVLMDVQSAKILHTYAKIGGQPWAASFSPNGKYLACGTGSGKALDTINIGDARVTAVTMSNDGKVLAVTGSDEVARVYDVSAVVGK